MPRYAGPEKTGGFGAVTVEFVGGPLDGICRAMPIYLRTYSIPVVERIDYSAPDPSLVPLATADYTDTGRRRQGRLLFGWDGTV